MSGRRSPSLLPVPPREAPERRFARRQFIRDGNENARQTGAIAEAHIKLGDLLGLVTGLMHEYQHRAAFLLLENLVSSKLGDIELDCTQSAFKTQLTKFLNTHDGEMSLNASVYIQRRIDEDPNLRCQPAGSTSAIPSSIASDTGVLVDHSARRSLSKGTSRNSFNSRSLSRGRSRNSSNSLPNDWDDAGDLSDVDRADGSDAPYGIAVRHEDVGSVDWVHTEDRESIVSYGSDSVDGTRTPTAASSHHDSDEDSFWEQDFCLKSNAASDDDLSEHSYSEHSIRPRSSTSFDDDGKDWQSLQDLEVMFGPTRDAFMHADVEDLQREMQARRPNCV